MGQEVHPVKRKKVSQGRRGRDFIGQEVYGAGKAGGVNMGQTRNMRLDSAMQANRFHDRLNAKICTILNLHHPSTLTTDHRP